MRLSTIFAPTHVEDFDALGQFDEQLRALELGGLLVAKAEHHHPASADDRQYRLSR